MEAIEIEMIENPITGEKIEVAKHDLPEKMEWEQAKKACAAIGNGWRLPSVDELKEIHRLKDDIGGFKPNERYWSITENGDSSAWYFDFPFGSDDSASGKSNTGYIRAVKTI